MRFIDDIPKRIKGPVQPQAPRGVVDQGGQSEGK
jgi:hypothetical protein